MRVPDGDLLHRNLRLQPPRFEVVNTVHELTTDAGHRKTGMAVCSSEQTVLLVERTSTLGLSVFCQLPSS
jgi:hypothetical protein